ncbi:FK506-binding protein 15 isoform X2 [Gouania willdenowi]|uniref:FK506-binding protein 15 isoform X2 n=1 Tax=Gouania willdenowi TaxID=441366 RepID=UPI0010548138|nr:FK506-binding protein 15 isoform X2 [Gouania willdenowi]
MFGGDDEDGDFLSSSGGAKLASLFGLDQDTSQGNQSFQYTAPKQPRRSSNPAPANQKSAPPTGAPAVLFATAVQAFRCINGQYVKQGKLGAAVLGTHATKEYKLLLYLSQQKQVTAAKIHSRFALTVQPNNYCSFYDDQRQNWSLMFDSDKNASDFCKEVCLAKANSVPALDSVMVQDLSPGEGQAVENGDSLEVVYTGWLLQNHAIGQMFDTNQNKEKLLRLKIGAGKLIKGWEEGMMGMKKSGRRLIVIPPSLAYGSKGVPDRVPADSTLVFEAELRRVKFSKDNSSDQISVGSRDSAAPSPAPSPSTRVENLSPDASVQTAASGPGRPGDPPLRAKSNSLNEQLTNPDATKAKLISRMAKMGQPMLPFLTGTAAHPESSDSELEETNSSSMKPRPAVESPVAITSAAPPSAHAHPHPVMTPGTTQLSLPGFQPYSYTQSAAAHSQLQPIAHVYPTQAAPYPGSGDVTSFLMTEARQHNTEIRLAVGKVADKVDQMLSKVDDIHRQGGVSMNVSNMSLETTMIMHNIQRIIQENECLKKEVFDKSSRIEEQNRKIGDLINQNQRYMEESHVWLEQRSDSLKSTSEQNQTRLLQAEQDKHISLQDCDSAQVRLTEDLASSASRISQLQLEASDQQQKAAELQSKLNTALNDVENYRQSASALHSQLEELKEAAERAQTQYRIEKQRRKEMELRVNNAEEELLDLKTDKESLERTLAERKSKWQAERQRRDEEVEELRRSSQQELDKVRAQLRKARTSSDHATSEQLSQLQAELEDEWKAKCARTLDSAEEQHRRAVTELMEQRDILQEKLTQLQEKCTALKQSRDLEEQSLQENEQQKEEQRALQEKYSALQQHAAQVQDELERRVAELERTRESSGDTAAEVKRVMNGVFHSLRAEFDVRESYSGQTVLSVIVSTIKSVTLQLLSGTEQTLPSKEEKEEEEEEEKEEKEEQEDGGEEEKKKHVEEESALHTLMNGERADEEDEERQDVSNEEGAPVMEKEKTKLSEELHPGSSAEAQGQEEEKEDHGSAVDTPTHLEVKEEEEYVCEQLGESSPPERSESQSKHTEEEEEVEITHGPPAKPPPPPTESHTDVPPLSLLCGSSPSPTGSTGEEHGEELFFHDVSSPDKSSLPAAAEEEEEKQDEEEEEMVRKEQHPSLTCLSVA